MDRTPSKAPAKRGGRLGKNNTSSARKAAPSSAARSSGKKTSNKKNFEHYTALARAAATSGDTVGSENFYQHAEHYFRRMKEEATR